MCTAVKRGAAGGDVLVVVAVAIQAVPQADAGSVPASRYLCGQQELNVPLKLVIPEQHMDTKWLSTQWIVPPLPGGLVPVQCFISHSVPLVLLLSRVPPLVP